MGGYRFLMENYREGDYICLFGFSRGAYTARCLAGMLHKVGLLPKSNEEHIAFAYRKYLDDTPEGKQIARGFKRAFSISVPIEFVGVWDTVASVGCTFKHLPFTDSNTIIRRFRHALALDEHRVQFMPNPWHKPSPDPKAAKDDPDGGTAIFGAARGFKLPGTVRGWLSLPGDDTMENDTDYDFEYHSGWKTDVQEVWFAGCHSDVGGGSTPNNDIHTLANPSLQWMISEVLKHAPYVLFRPDAFTYDKAFSTLTVTKTDLRPKPARPRIPSTFRRAPGAKDAALWAVSTPIPPNTAPTADSSTLDWVDFEEGQTVVAVEQTEPATDANAPKNDKLVQKPIWLVLEYIPIFQYYQDGKGTWHWRFRWNALRPREIYDSTPNFHASVRLRKNYEGKWLTKFIPTTGE
ncbi:hypothetical protein FRC01_012832, partial [Tulasnella sp. 417]